MKKLLLLFSLLASTCLAQTDTNNPSGPLGSQFDQVLSFLSKGSNWMIAPYGIFDTGRHSGGAGLGIGYKLSDFVVPTMRLDWVDSRLFMPSGNIQLQLPITVGKVTVIPLAFTGLAIPLSSKGANNGSAVGIYGVGAAIRLSSHFDLIGDYEHWSGFDGQQIRAGFVWKF